MAIGNENKCDAETGATRALVTEAHSDTRQTVFAPVVVRIEFQDAVQCTIVQDRHAG